MECIKDEQYEEIQVNILSSYTKGNKHEYFFSVLLDTKTLLHFFAKSIYMFFPTGVEMWI